jgi:hypothetical protein
MPEDGRAFQPCRDKNGNGTKRSGHGANGAPSETALSGSYDSGLRGAAVRRRDSNGPATNPAKAQQSCTGTTTGFGLERAETLRRQANPERTTVPAPDLQSPRATSPFTAPRVLNWGILAGKPVEEAPRPPPVERPE